MSSFIPFQHPTTILVAGPTFSGKTTFVKKIIRNRFVQPAPERIIWIYKEKDDKTDFASVTKEFPNIPFFSDLDPEIFESINSQERNLVFKMM